MLFVGKGLAAVFAVLSRQTVVIHQRLSNLSKALASQFEFLAHLIQMFIEGRTGDNECFCDVGRLTVFYQEFTDLALTLG